MVISQFQEYLRSFFNINVLLDVESWRYDQAKAFWLNDT